MNIRISRGEWYPMYSIHEDDGDTYNSLVNVSDDKYKSWEETFKRFMDLQNKLERIWESQHE